MNQFYYRKTCVYGFHGCHRDLKSDLLSARKKFNVSTKSYDWLGSGVYFWENDELRALSWAKERYGDDGTVIGAKIILSDCFDISNSFARDLLAKTYDHLRDVYLTLNTSLPTNKPHPLFKGNPADNILRYLDRAVVELALHNAMSEPAPKNYSIVRAAFQEGFELYPGSAFREHDHIHLCVRNPELLTELFDPEEYL